MKEYVPACYNERSACNLHVRLVGWSAEVESLNCGQSEQVATETHVIFIPGASALWGFDGFISELPIFSIAALAVLGDCCEDECCAFCVPAVQTASSSA
jgi:hypothetical protein